MIIKLLIIFSIVIIGGIILFPQNQDLFSNGFDESKNELTGFKDESINNIEKLLNNVVNEVTTGFDNTINAVFTKSN